MKKCVNLKYVGDGQGYRVRVSNGLDFVIQSMIGDVICKMVKYNKINIMKSLNEINIFVDDKKHAVIEIEDAV